MKLVVNGETTEVKATTLAELMVECGFDEMPVATALNMAVVRKNDRATTLLHEGDRVEILVPMQGG
jgi:sulfur carrier protein